VISRGHVDIAKYLISKGEKITKEMFYLAAKQNDFKVLDFVLQ